MLRERHIQTLLGEAFARSFPRFRPLFDKVQQSLEAFLAQHSFAADRNIEMLVRLIDLPAPESTLIRLAAAFCYGSLNRSLFPFVDSQSRIVYAIEKAGAHSGVETGARPLLVRPSMKSSRHTHRTREVLGSKPSTMM